jgi:hypothetical protein
MRRQADDAPVLKHGTARFTLRPMDRLLDGTLRGHRTVLRLLKFAIVLANVRTLVEDATLWRIDRDGGNHLNTARANPTDLDLTAEVHIAQKSGR